MSERVIRTDFSRGEQIGGLVWLALGALCSLTLEVVYLTARLPWFDGASVSFPITILIAFWFNGVLTRTARLWSENPYIAGLPGLAWVTGFLAFMLGGAIGDGSLLANNILSLLLFVAGIAGSVWPFFTQE
ncbi:MULTISPECIES: hypothetical protein [Corynebacterium]|uniref:Uncharacterized protein n=1 Tax=Corynebacterium singulare TaxID=161899 RepID=A0A0B6EQ68_9CORY|nr:MULTISPECIES: hypothetical protein [Corynebacterium]AJI78617.1 hypothetical protein CSING_05395 [Corynebacterium singulare]MCG7276997.1 hypothetical protein [Corynebacterium singulare]MCQ9675722.1 hypothetical protein [Corynebacterium sp. BF-R-2]OFT61570.1 hypothetical protein HMPREF3149_05590 [Corynebacterium sp. HMSC05E07]